MKKYLFLFYLLICSFLFSVTLTAQNVFGPDTANYKRYVHKEGNYPPYVSDFLYNNNPMPIGNDGTTKYRAFYQWDIPDNVIPDNSQIDTVEIFFIYSQALSNYYIAVRYFNVEEDLLDPDADTLWNRTNIGGPRQIGSGHGNKYGYQGTGVDTVYSVFTANTSFADAIHNSLAGNKFILGITAETENFGYEWNINNATMTMRIVYSPPQQLVTVDQKLTNDASYDSVGHFEGNKFVPYLVPHTFSFPVNSTQYFLADTNIATTQFDYEKYKNWNNDNSNVINYNKFTIYNFTNSIFSKFDSTTEATVRNELEGISGLYNGNIKFADPWLRDSTGSKGKLNRGINAVLHTNSSPFNITINTNNQGVFLNQDPTFDSNIPNYSVKAVSPQDIPLGGNLGTHRFYFLNWGGTGVTYEDANSLETGVVFTSEDAVAQANLKGTQLSNDVDAFSTNSQRKFVKSDDGYLHKVYQSLGHVWYEISPDNGQTWEIMNDGKPLDNGEAKLPAID